MIRIALMLLLTAGIAFGQNEKEVLHVKYGATPLDNAGNSGLLHSIDMNIKFPLLLKERYQLGGGLGYENLWASGTSRLEQETLHGLNAQLLFNKKQENNNGFLAFVSVGAYSDFHDLSGEDMRVSAGIRFKKVLKNDSHLWYGLGYSKQFFGNLLAPFIDFNWKMSDRFTLSGPFPVNTKLTYRLGKRSNMHLFIKPENATFRLSEKVHESRYVQKKQWNLGLGWDFLLTKHWMLTLRSGYAAKRKLEVFDADQNGVLSILTFDVRGTKRQPDYSYEQKAWFAEVMVAWVLGSSKDE